MESDVLNVIDHLPRVLARSDFEVFARQLMPELDLQPYHKVYYRILDKFAKGEIKRLIITMPPRHGKSQGSSRLLPAFMLGLNPSTYIAIGSYAASLAQDFCRDVQRLMDNNEYRYIFPNTILPPQNSKSAWLRNANVFEIIGKGGAGLRVVGRGGALSGKTVDIAILDDIYKDAAEGNSPVIRDGAFKWYTSVVRKRMPKQQLIVFTRWHEEDLIGHIESSEDVVNVSTWSEIDNAPKGAWIKLNFEAIKTGAPTELDPRNEGEALWSTRYDIEALEADRRLDPVYFECLNQGNPSSQEGRLYSNFHTYQQSPEEIGVIVGKGSYTDTADTGDDYLCCICYDKVRIAGVDHQNKPRFAICITDVLYTQEAMETTTASVPAMFERNKTRYAMIESNNGGRPFALMVRGRTQANIQWFTQSKNKESRILTTAPLVMQSVYMPVDWAQRWGKFHEHITRYLRNFVGNKWHDAPDALTGAVEKDIQATMNGGGVVRLN